MSEKLLRRLTSMAVNAVVWGAAWFGLTVLVFAALILTGRNAPNVSMLDAIPMGVKVGVMGGLAGGAFSAFVSFFWRGRRLSQISWLRFGLGGAIVSGVFVPAFMWTMNFLTGDLPVKFSDFTMDIVLATVFGGIAAATTMWLAQRAEREALAAAHESGRLDAGALSVARIPQREREGAGFED